MTSHHVTCQCDHSHIPLSHQNKRKIKKRNIKLRKIDKRKRKMLMSKYTITLRILNGDLRMERIEQY